MQTESVTSKATCELQLAIVQSKQLLELRYDCVLRLGEDFDEHVLVERVETDDHRESTHEFGNHAELDQITSFDLSGGNRG